LSLPSPPKPARTPCTLTALVKSPDGSLTAAQVEAALRARADDVYRCETRRALAIDAWPRMPDQR
jgi:hypothetical protein